MSTTSTQNGGGTPLIVKKLDQPDETRPAGRGQVELARLGQVTMARATFEPGWRWSEHVKPNAGTDLCQATHTGYVVSGRQVVRMADGAEVELEPGDAFVVGSGHDAWVVGDEACVTIDFSGAESFAARNTAATGHTAKTIDDMQSIHGGLVKLAADELGVESFGMQVLDLPPGFTDYPEHDHTADGQEEVYVVLAGSGECEVDGTRLPLTTGQTLRVEPGSRRKLWAGPDGARILAIGSAAGRAYERPEDFRLGGSS